MLLGEPCVGPCWQQPGQCFLDKHGVCWVGGEGKNHSALVVWEKEASRYAPCLAPWSTLGLICTFYGTLTPKSTHLLLLHVRNSRVKCQDFLMAPKSGWGQKSLKQKMKFSLASSGSLAWMSARGLARKFLERHQFFS